MAFQLFAKAHDPNAGLSGPWTFRVQLDQGESITAASVTIVDALDIPIISPDLIVTSVTNGVIVAPIFGVSFYLEGGTNGAFYLLRCRYSKSSSPVTTYDYTLRLRVAHT